MTHLFGKELLIQFTVRCFVNFFQVLRAFFCFEGGLWGLIVQSNPYSASTFGTIIICLLKSGACLIQVHYNVFACLRI